MGTMVMAKWLLAVIAVIISANFGCHPFRKYVTFINGYNEQISIVFVNSPNKIILNHFGDGYMLSYDYLVNDIAIVDESGEILCIYTLSELYHISKYKMQWVFSEKGLYARSVPENNESLKAMIRNSEPAIVPQYRSVITTPKTDRN
ncbi:MAG: hypothetical protein NTX50_15895 [Candidatus Sumerlaeota bacterium]|nr:hypothetical protein [Candidatus Sumerlaeota bacterium]